MDEHVHAVPRRIGGEPEIGDDEPLRRQGIVAVAWEAGGRCRHHVHAGCEIADRLIDRKRRGGLGIELLLLDLELPAPHVRTALVRDALELVGSQVALEVLTDDRVEQVAVADPVDRDLDARRVDAHHRDAALAAARQHIGLANEARERCAVTHIDGDIGGLDQVLLHHRRQAGAQRDRIMFAVLQPFDTELLVVD